MTRRDTTTRRRTRRRRLPTSPSYRPPVKRPAALVERRVPQARLQPREDRVVSIAEAIRRAREAAPTRPPPPLAPVEPLVAPAPEESRPRRRTWAVVALTALVLLTAASAQVMGVWDRSDSPSGRGVVSTRSTEVQGSGAAASLMTRIRVLADGTLRVRQRIRSPEPMTSIVVAAPVDPYLTLGTVTASRLEVTAGGVRVGGSDRVRLDSAAFAFDKTRSVRLSYVLSGALQYTGDSNRALARVTSLDLFTDRDLEPATYVFSGAQVLNLACSQASSDDPPQACGTQRGKEWVVRLAQPGSDLNRVMAQLDLVPAA